MEAQLEALGTGELFGLWFQSLFVGLTMNALSICIMLVIYGRMIEVYLTTSCLLSTSGYGAAGTLMAFAAQLVILADVAFAAGGAVLFLHAVRTLVALIAPIGCIEQALTAIVAVEFNEAVGVAVNGAEPATVAHILSPVVVVAVFTICDEMCIRDSSRHPRGHRQSCSCSWVREIRQPSTGR